MDSSRVEEEKYERLIVVKSLDAAVENISDYSMWLDRLVQEIEQQNPEINSRRFELFLGDTRFDVRQGKVWAKALEDVKGELMKTDEYKKQVEILSKELEENKGGTKEIQRQLEIAKKYKMSAEKKIRDLHGKANKLPTLELEFKILKDKLLRAEKSRDIIVEKLKEKQTKELRERTSTETSMMRGGTDSFTNNRDPSISTDRPLGYGKTHTLRQMADNVVDVEYDFKTKTEMKSLKGLVKYLNKELISQKNKNLNLRLFNFKKKAKTFEKLTQMYNSGVKLSRAPVEIIKDQSKKTSKAQNNLKNLLESNLESKNNELQVLIEESEEQSINESKQ